MFTLYTEHLNVWDPQNWKLMKPTLAQILLFDIVIIILLDTYITHSWFNAILDLISYDVINLSEAAPNKSAKSLSSKWWYTPGKHKL